MGILMVVVVPQIATVFEDSGKALPWNTQLLIFVAGLAGNYWWVVVPAAGWWRCSASGAGPAPPGGGRWSTGWR